MIEKPSRVSTWKKKKHRNDYNHGKCGWNVGNIRYQRSKATRHDNIAMGRARMSVHWK